jgi:myo-inositol-1(or 4)-monophosphatase
MASWLPQLSLAIADKAKAVDLVTETDKAVEKMVSHTLGAKYPTFKFLGEETYQPGMQLTDQPTFVCDPIDGTTNFVHQYPYVSISLGFACDREPMVGVVYNPFTGLLYTGVKGEGSFQTDLNTGEKQRLPLKQPLEPLRQLCDMLVAIEWGSDRDGPNYENKVKTFGNLGRSKEQGGAMIHSFRSLGSAALNLCGVASGSLDLYWEGGPWAWDFCAGWVILKEAGGMIVDANPGRWEIPVDHRMLLAVRPSPDAQGQKEVVEEFWKFVAGKLDYVH